MNFVILIIWSFQAYRDTVPQLCIGRHKYFLVWFSIVKFEVAFAVFLGPGRINAGANFGSPTFIIKDFLSAFLFVLVGGRVGELKNIEE